MNSILNGFSNSSIRTAAAANDAGNRAGQSFLLGAEVDVGLGVDDVPDPLADDAMVISDEYGDHLRSLPRALPRKQC